MNITASLVIYNNKKKMIDRVVNSFFSINQNLLLYIIDHSKNDAAQNWYTDNRIIYIFEKNSGYGAGHNSALRLSANNSDYHIILNPDVYFPKPTIDSLVLFMEENEDVGLVMPKILYPNGRLQYLCKLLPTPWDWFVRRFFKFLPKNRFELQESGYNSLIEVPYLSGCFMFFRVSSLKIVGGFDEKYFLHCEDTDISRRMNIQFKTVYYPFAHVFHEHQKESHKSLRMLLIHISSTIYYFNKWGWFFDKERKKINKQTLNQIRINVESSLKR